MFIRGPLAGREEFFVREVSIYAPASIGNIGPGFDVLGVAITGIGDVVTALPKPDSGVEILAISGLAARLPREAARNTAGIAAIKVIERIGAKKGLMLKIRKGVPAASGLGSSAASAVAGAVAANAALSGKLTKPELLQIATEAEAEVSGGFFADNTASALYGGGTVTRTNSPLDVIPLGGLAGVRLIMVTPEMELPTREARKVLPETVELEQFVANMGNAAAIVAAFATKDPLLFARSINDVIIEPARAKLIPGFADVKKAALKNGAYGCSISGAGPTVFATTTADGQCERIAASMRGAFRDNGLNATISICEIDPRGAREAEAKQRGS